MALARPLALPLGDLPRLRQRVAALAENRPAVYRMRDPTGRVVYVGKAKRLRTRLLSYFRARYPEDKAARILHATAEIIWDYVPSEFAAFLGELRQIRQHRPVFNVRMNRNRRAAFIKISEGPAPKVYVGSTPAGEGIRHYGPFIGAQRLRDAVKVLNDLLGLRDCTLAMPIRFAEQGDLFADPPRAGCMRFDLGTCAGPCGGLITERAYGARIREAVAFIEGRDAAPLRRVVREMADASEREAFERAAWWRARFEALTWLLSACVRVHATLESMSFVYVDPGIRGDDRAYVIRRAQVRASAPAPHTPIEREAFRALVAEHAGVSPDPAPLPVSAIDETLLIVQWFRRRPAALRRAVALDTWLERYPATGEASC